jgi:holo-[acyl-carrier protein] synthase
MIIGVGVDLVEIARFQRTIERTPAFITRVFAEAERQGSAQTLAGKFAAKEAFIKALGDSAGLAWHEVQVVKNAAGKPSLEVSGQVAEITRAAGIEKFHLSITHDAGMACAFVVAEGRA